MFSRLSEVSKLLPQGFDPARAALAGAVASAAYAAEMYVDMAVTGSRLDDVQLLEGAIRGKRARVPVLGMALHLLNGAALGEVYAAIAAPYLPGPRWAKGVTFGALFLVAVWPAVPLLDRIHPLIKQGELPPLNRPVSIGQNVARHLVFGAVLALLYNPHNPR